MKASQDFILMIKERGTSSNIPVNSQTGERAVKLTYEASGHWPLEEDQYCIDHVSEQKNKKSLKSKRSYNV